MTRVFIRARQKRRGGGHVKMEAEIGTMQPQAKEASGLQNLDGAGRVLPLKAPEGERDA